MVCFDPNFAPKTTIGSFKYKQPYRSQE